jgi:hypothetical protein
MNGEKPERNFSVNVVEMLINDKIASNPFQAAHIANGLKLGECKTDEERLTRARLYRDWRVSQIFPKSDTASCYAKAIAGEAVPVTPMFEGVLHSELIHCPNCPDQGWYAVGSNDDGWEQVPCEFCYTVQNSYFNKMNDKQRAALEAVKEAFE